MNFFSKKHILNNSPENKIGTGEISKIFDFNIKKENPIYDIILKILLDYLDKNASVKAKFKVVFMDVDAWVDYCNIQQINKNVVTYDKIILILDAQNVKSSLNLHYVGLQSGLLKYKDCVLWDNYNYKTLNSIIPIVLNELVDC